MGSLPENLEQGSFTFHVINFWESNSKKSGIINIIKRAWGLRPGECQLPDAFYWIKKYLILFLAAKLSKFEILKIHLHLQVITHYSTRANLNAISQKLTFQNLCSPEDSNYPENFICSWDYLKEIGRLYF